MSGLCYDSKLAESKFPKRIVAVLNFLVFLCASFRQSNTGYHGPGSVEASGTGPDVYWFLGEGNHSASFKSLSCP